MWKLSVIWLEQLGIDDQKIQKIQKIDIVKVNVIIQSLLLEFQDQQHQHHQGPCQKCKMLGSIHINESETLGRETQHSVFEQAQQGILMHDQVRDHSRWWDDYRFLFSSIFLVTIYIFALCINYP